MKRASMTLALVGALCAQPPSWSYLGNGTPGALATGNDGRLYALGASGANGVGQCWATTQVKRYDPLAGQWNTTVNAPAQLPSTENRCQGSALSAPDGRIYLIGGRSGMGPWTPPSKTVSAYDPRTDTWTTGPSLVTARTKPAVAVGSDRMIYAFGGVDQWGNGITTVERMDPLASNPAWSLVPLAFLPAGQGWSATSGYDGTMYLASSASLYSSTTGIPNYLSASYSGTPFALTAGPNENIHFVTGSDLYQLAPAPLSYVSNHALVFGSANRVEAEPAEGAVYMVGDWTFERFGPLKARFPAGTGTHWRFDGSLASTGCNAAPLFQSFGTTTGRVKQAVDFNGTTNEIRWPSSPCVSAGTGSFSLDFWIKPNAASLSGLKAILDHRDSQLRGYHVALYNGNIVFQMGTGSNVYKNYGVKDAAKFKLPAGVWSHVVISVARPSNGPVRGSIYVNATHAGEFTPLAGSLTNASEFRVAGHMDNQPSLRFGGALDELQVHHKALTWQEARAIFLAGGEGKQ